MKRGQSLFGRVVKVLQWTEQKKESLSRVEGVWTDIEIVKAEDDRFGYQDYAATLANRVVDAKGTPFTIGIFGRWGSGKTSLMRLIEAALPEETKEGSQLHSIWINLWRLDNRDEVWKAFLQTLFIAVRRELPLWRKVDKRDLLRQMVSNSYRIVLAITPMIVGLLLARPETGWEDVRQLILDPIAGSATLVTIVLGLWTLGKPIIEAAREVVSFDLQAALKYAPYEAQVTELMQLHGQFEKTVRDLVGESGRLVVFVDDLDRCSPDKIPEILEALKLFTAAAGCVYVMGLDYNVTRHGIVRKYGFSEDEGAEYLEKIVQIPFHLPPLEGRRVAAFVREDYPDVCQKSRWAPEIFSLGLESNPRRVKRALNIYRTLLDLAEVRVRAWEMDPVDPELLAKMVLIQNRFRRLYDHLVKKPAYLREIEVSALAEGGNGETFRDAPEVRCVLLGKPETKESDAEPGLIGDTDWAALRAMLRAGEKRFSDDDQHDQISSYIYLISTVETTAREIRPNRKEREALLGNNPSEIEAQVDEILDRGQDRMPQHQITQSYTERLEDVLNDQRYTEIERRSAMLALNLLGNAGERTMSIISDSLRRFDCPTGPEILTLALGENPRRVREATRVCKAALRMANSKYGAWETHRLDKELIVKMAAIQARFPALYNELVQNPTLVVELETWAYAVSHSDEVDQTRVVQPVTENIGIEFERLVPELGRAALVAMLRTGKASFDIDPDESGILFRLIEAAKDSTEVPMLESEREAMQETMQEAPARPYAPVFSIFRSRALLRFDDVAATVTMESNGDYRSEVRFLDRHDMRFQASVTVTDPGLQQLLQHFEADRIDSPEYLRVLGQSLYRMVFSGEAGDHLEQELRDGRAIRIRLQFGDEPRLDSLPWELMYIEDFGFLSSQRTVAVVRDFSSTAKKVNLPLVRPPLKLLVAWATPRNLPPLYATEAVAAILKAFEEMSVADRAVVDVLEHASHSAFFQKVWEGGYDLIHFIGYGGVWNEEGVLYCEDEDGLAFAVTRGSLIDRLNPSRTPRLMVLDACPSPMAEPWSMNGPSALAAALVAGGRLPAVVVMGYPVPIESAAIFFQDFYKTLVQNGQVDAATAAGRWTLASFLGLDRRHWGAPRLYVSVPEGVIFKLR